MLVIPNRRSFLTGAAALSISAGITGRQAFGSLPAPVAIAAGPATARLAGAASKPAEVWAYNGAVPGTVLRARQGQPFAARLQNGLPQPTTVHWHGIRIDNRMDGVPGMTQPAVQPGEGFDYLFTPPDSGTFWYHPHFSSYEQVGRGLFGALIVDPADPADEPIYDRDIVLVLNDWRLDGDGQLINNFGSIHDRIHAGRLGNTITVNGEVTPEIKLERFERVRIRLINAASARIFQLRLENAAPKLIAVDGQGIGPENGYREGFVLAPGNRADFMLDVTADTGAVLSLADWRTERNELARFTVAKTKKRDGVLVAPIALKPNAIPLPDLGRAREVPLLMTGGAKSETDMSVMAADPATIWAFNGVSGMVGNPLFTAKSGETIRMKLTNDTVWPHAIHVHGINFRVIKHSANPEPKPYWWDTFLLEAKETAEFAFVTPGPGHWMIHCHMLDHQAAGMDTWFVVEA